MSRILILIHGDPQDYPPTLNAINELCILFTHVDIVYKPYRNVDWIYPENVNLIKAGDTINFAWHSCRHSTSNCSYRPRPLMKISGMVRDDHWLAKKQFKEFTL